MSQFDTAQNLVNRVAPEVGLNVTGNLFSSTDQSFIQMRNLVKSCGQELLTMHEWESLRREWTFTTDGTSTYNENTLPTEWAYPINDTMWDRTNQRPVAGGLSAQQWQQLEARDATGAVINLGYRFTQRKLFLWPQPPPAGSLIALEYISRNWVLTAGLVYQDGPTANDDTILYPDVLFVKMLKAKFLGARGFDTTKADNEFNKALEGWTGSLQGAQVLRPSRRRVNEPLIDIRANTSDTGYG